MHKTARDMTPDCECSGENDSVLDAAKRLAELNVGAMPICGEDNRLKGMLSDRDIVAKPESSAPRASVGHNPPEDQADGSEQPAESGAIADRLYVSRSSGGCISIGSRADHHGPDRRRSLDTAKLAGLRSTAGGDLG